MSYERIILELMGRIQSLEETAVALDQRISLIECEEDEHIESDSVSSTEKITRTAARNEAIARIQELDPDYIVEKAKRNEGSGIKVCRYELDAKPTVIIKFYHSKIYQPDSGLVKQPDGYEHGWHIVRLNDIMNSIYDLCLFSMCDTNGKWHFFLFSPAQLGIYRDENRANAKDDELWLNFSVQGDSVYELREKKVDVAKHYNNWDVIRL